MVSISNVANFEIDLVHDQQTNDCYGKQLLNTANPI